jgi:hypothetical protein
MGRFWQFVFCAALPVCAQVKFTQDADKIAIEIDGKPFSEFFLQDPAAPKPYLHPLRSASGAIVTRRFPMEKIPGEVYDHPHHRGLWFTHGNVNGVDFWMNETSYMGKTPRGRILLNKITSVQGGPKSGTISGVWTWEDHEGKKLLTEERTMVFHSHPTLRIIDLDLKLTAISEVTFGDTKEGTFAIRMATALDEKHGGKMVAADGRTGEKAIWGKRSPWVDYYGQMGGETLGIAILDHPQNPGHPTHWHARAYGLFAANIFGLRDFYADKTKDGSVTLKPGESLRFRYRVVIHPGDTQAAGIAKLYQDWTK